MTNFIERDREICEAHAGGETLQALALRFGVSRQRIHQIVGRGGPSLRMLSAASTAERDRLICEAWDRGELIKTIAARFGLSLGHVSHIARKNGLPRRAQGPNQQAFRTSITCVESDPSPVSQ